MEHNPDRLSIWPGYFNAKISRRNGRRVPKDASVIKPDLEGLFLAARKVGLRKIKREEGTSHPRRPHAKEGRLWVSRKGSKQTIGANSKEEILQLIGGEWRQMQRDLKEAQADREGVGAHAARVHELQGHGHPDHQVAGGDHRTAGRA